MSDDPVLQGSVTELCGNALHIVRKGDMWAGWIDPCTEVIRRQAGQLLQQ